MSKIKVNEIEKISGSGITIPTGTSFTVTDGIPATNLSGTIADARLPTVPVTKGGTGLTSLGSAGQAIKVNSGGNALEFGAVAGGKLLQVVQATMASTVSTSANSAVDTGLTVNITPSATSSKVLVFVNHPFVRKQGDNSVAMHIVRASTTIANIGPNFDTSDSQQITDTVTGMFLDTPNTTSATTYKTQFTSNNGYIYAASGSSVIICMEIGA